VGSHQHGLRDLKRVTVDTTVQPKAITFPTDAKLLHAAIKGFWPTSMVCGCGKQLSQVARAPSTPSLGPSISDPEKMTSREPTYRNPASFSAHSTRKANGHG
jgi:hypothetical protein